MSRYTFPHAGDPKLSELANKAREANKVTHEFTSDDDDLGDPEDNRPVGNFSYSYQTPDVTESVNSKPTFSSNKFIKRS